MYSIPIGLSVVMLLVIIWFIFYIISSVKKVKELNAKKDCLHDDIVKYTIQIENQQSTLESLTAQQCAAQGSVDRLEARKNELKDDVADQSQQIELLKQTYEAAEEQYRRNYMNQRQTWLEERQAEYVKMQEDFVEQFREENRKKMDAAKQLDETLSKLSASVTAATELAKKAAAEEDYIQFHSLQLTEKDIAEINKIEAAVIGVSPLAESAIHKVIWKVYYEKAYTDLIGRIFGSTPKTGIYKITNTENQMCYIGQAVNIAERWRQHIKRAIGAEERTNNKLYPAMDRIGPWRFTFEVVEECPRDKLSEREDFWQDFYKAKEYGYSIK